MTFSLGVGDVTAVNSNEKIYATIIIMTTTFLYAFLFGNLASMVDDLTPKFQREFESHYWKVLEYAKSAKLESFINKIHVIFLFNIRFFNALRLITVIFGLQQKALMRTIF